MNAVAMQSFGFEDQLVRVIDRDDSAWFVANDVCGALEIGNSRDAVSRLEEDERDCVGITDAMGRDRETTIISESGVYALIFTSRKAAAKRFRKWVTQEVLPAIRATGRYEVPRPANDRVIDLEGALGTQDDRHAIKTALLMINTYKDLYGQQAGREMLQKLGFPVPQVHLAPAPTGPGEAPAPKEGDLHAWSVAAKLKPSRREATHLSELFQSYTAWCDRIGAVAMHAQKFRDAMVMLFNHEEHPEMIRVVLAA